MAKYSVIVIILLLIIMLGWHFFGASLWKRFNQQASQISQSTTQNKMQKRTVADVINTYGSSAKNRLMPYFHQANSPYPPTAMTWLAMKEEAALEVWAANKNGGHDFIHRYDIKRLSGQSGPKRREGDKQVPEGLYKIIGLNPNSSYHLSMKLNYPNEFDLIHANEEGRKEPGTNIFIHGKAVSVGCLAMGDQTIEELFVLANDVGVENISVIIAPHDPRQKPLPYDKAVQAAWVNTLYQDIENSYRQFAKKPQTQPIQSPPVLIQTN